MGSINASGTGLPGIGYYTAPQPAAGLTESSAMMLAQAGVNNDVIAMADEIIAMGQHNVASPPASTPVYGTPSPSSVPTTAPTPTALPSVDPATTPDSTTSTASLDAADTTYPQLTVAHVQVLRAVKTPESVIAQLAATNPTPAAMDTWIQTQLMQAPEAWDQAVGNPIGTARAGLGTILPGVQLPDPTSTTSQLPAAQAPSTDQQASTYANGQNDLMKNIVMAGGAGILGLLGFRAMKHRKAAAQAAIQGAAAVTAGGGEAASRTLGMTASAVTDAGMGAGATDLTSMMIMHGRPAQAWQLSNGMMPGLEHSGQAMNMAAHWNLPADVALRQARFEMAASTGQLMEGALWEHGSGIASVIESIGRGRGAAAGVAAAADGHMGALGRLLEGEGAAKLTRLLELL